MKSASDERKNLIKTLEKQQHSKKKGKQSLFARLLSILTVILAVALFLLGEGSEYFAGMTGSDIRYDSIPEYSGEPYITINQNMPDFDLEKIDVKENFEEYSELDQLGRCGVAFANLCKELMPTQKRGSISKITPSGWNNQKYDNISQKYLYNRCHLIGFQLAGENANEKNLITGTSYFNVTGMIPFENQVKDYIEETDHHVLYRVTPIYEGDNLVANGVAIEAWSVEDEGEGICFHVFVYNVQPGIGIDYSDGSSWSLSEK